MLILPSVGNARDVNGRCLAFGPGATFLRADCGIQIFLSFFGLCWGVVVLRNLRRQGKFGRNPISYTLVFAELGLLGLCINRVIMFSKSYTPELYTACCIFVLGDPRRYHQLRFYELGAILAGALFGLLALTNVAVSWLDTALKTAKLSRKSPASMKYLRRFYIGFEVFVVVIFITVLAINTSYVSILLLVGVVILVVTFIVAVRKIYPVLRSSSVVKGAPKVDTYERLLRQIRLTTYGIVFSCLILLISAAMSVYLSSGPQDWKDWTKPDEISLHMVFNGWQVLGYTLALLVIMWFLYKRSMLTRSSSRAGVTSSFRSYVFSKSSKDIQRQDSTGIDTSSESL